MLLFSRNTFTGIRHTEMQQTVIFQLIQERMAEAGIRNMGAYMRTMALSGYVPVSYTHLDVYKRQARAGGFRHFGTKCPEVQVPQKEPAGTGCGGKAPYGVYSLGRSRYFLSIFPL